MNRATLEELHLIATRLEDCILEGIPPHSGYKGAAKKEVKKLLGIIRSHIHATDNVKEESK